MEGVGRAIGGAGGAIGGVVRKAVTRWEAIRFGANRLLLKCLFENSFDLLFEEIHIFLPRTSQ